MSLIRLYGKRLHRNFGTKDRVLEDSTQKSTPLFRLKMNIAHHIRKLYSVMENMHRFLNGILTTSAVYFLAAYS